MRQTYTTYALYGFCAFSFMLAAQSRPVYAVAEVSLPPIFANAFATDSNGTFMLAMGERKKQPALPPSPDNEGVNPYATDYGLDIEVTPEMARKYERKSHKHKTDEGGVTEKYDHDASRESMMKPEELLQIRTQAEKGDASAQGVLGELYHEGIGVDYDLRQAFYWFRKGAAQGDFKSMKYLGRYYQGEFPSLLINEDLEEAEKWLRPPAKSGDTQAMALLGMVLFKVVRAGDESRAKEANWWYNRATGGPWDKDYMPSDMDKDVLQE